MNKFIIVLMITNLLMGNALAKKSFLPKAFEANFIQKKKSILSKKISQKSLNIKYQFPSDFYLQEGGVSPTVYVCNKSKVWIYTPPFEKNEPGNLATGSTSKHCYSKIFSALNNGLNKNKAYGVQAITTNHYQLEFMGAAQAQLGVDKIDLYFKDGNQNFENLKSLVIHYKGENNPLTLETVSLNPVSHFPASTFKFIPPKNTSTTQL